MKYTKPQLTALSSALEIVRGGKGMPVRTDSAYPNAFTATASAYEADE